MEKTGTTLAGQKLWSKDEIRILCRLYPAYREAFKALPSRTPKAIQTKAWRLGITKPLKIWSDDELGCLKIEYRKGTPMAELKLMLPGKTAKQICSRASASRWRRPPKPPKVTGLTAFDDVRDQAFSRRLTMRDLAYLSATGNYFLRKPARNNWQKIAKAVDTLEGNMAVVWNTP